MIYEFITPSDPITFVAPNDAMAYATSVLVGGGKAFCTREDGKAVPTFLISLSEKDIEASFQRNLGCPLKEFLESHCIEVAGALESFAYGSISRRNEFDDACASITDPDKLREFKARHEDRNRTSANNWVAYAWCLGADMRDKAQREGVAA